MQQRIEYIQMKQTHGENKNMADLPIGVKFITTNISYLINWEQRKKPIKRVQDVR